MVWPVTATGLPFTATVQRVLCYKTDRSEGTETAVMLLLIAHRDYCCYET
jgi:hypothetical protein